MIYLIKNKAGWIRIVETFVAILLIAIIVLIAIEQDNDEREDDSLKMQPYVISVVRYIEMNNSLRSEIVGIPSSDLPVEWEEFAESAEQTGERIIEKVPANLECAAKICAPSDACLLEEDFSGGKTVYAESAIISSTIERYNPRLLKLFCWDKTN